MPITDWAFIAAYLVFVPWLGARLSGKQATIRDFFLGGRKLSWWAVSGSIIATELSAVTFLIMPTLTFGDGGDLRYLQLALGTIAARFVIGWYFVPRFYEREIYSPYDFMGNQLGSRVRGITSSLFVLGAVLGQSVRVYVIALVLQVIAGVDLCLSIWLIGVFAIIWTLLGGISTVIWTDVIQFVLFFVGAIALLWTSLGASGVSPSEVWNAASESGRLRFLDLSVDPAARYTLWSGLMGFGVLTLASHGMDQMMAQRMFCCAGAREARKAIIWSGLSMALTALLMFVGITIWYFYLKHPMSVERAALMEGNANRLVPIFVMDHLPSGFRQLIFAGLFAAAITSLDSTLAALSQTSISTFYQRLKPGKSEAHYLFASRVFVVLWGIVLCGFALFCDTLKDRHQNLIDLALSMSAYTYGALLGTFLVAFLPLKADDRGVLFGVPSAVLTIVAMRWWQDVSWVPWMLVACGVPMALGLLRVFSNEPTRIVFGLGAIAVPISVGWTGVFQGLAWPWHFPLGTLVTFAFGWGLGARSSRVEGSSSGQ